MKLGETVTIAVLKLCPYVSVSLFSLCVPSDFGRRAGFDMNTSHVFPQGVLAAVTLVGGRAGDGGAKARTRCEVRLPLCSVTITALLRVGLGPRLLGQKP